jgi:hypothetical protein
MLPFCVAEEDAISTRNPVRKCDLSIPCYQLGVARALRKELVRNQNPARARSLAGRPENRYNFLCISVSDPSLFFQSNLTVSCIRLRSESTLLYHLPGKIRLLYPTRTRPKVDLCCIHHPADNSPGYANTLGIAKHVATATELCCERPITLPR